MFEIGSSRCHTLLMALRANKSGIVLKSLRARLLQEQAATPTMEAVIVA